MTSHPPVVLSIAGFDPSGGAGIIADVRTIVQFGCRPAAAITSLTFQNSAGVFGATHETAKSLRAQVVPIIAEHEISAVKVGMLPTAELISEVAAFIREGCLPPPVVDPVLSSSSGYAFMESEATEVWLRELMPLARLVTPNIPEAEALTEISIDDERAMHKAALQLRERGARAVLIKGGHASDSSDFGSQKSGERRAIDVLDDDGEIAMLVGEWIEAADLRGTGCIMSSAIAAGLGKGMELEPAVKAAKSFVAMQLSLHTSANTNA